MASRALSVPLEFRNQRYREELRDVLILHGLLCGKPDDLAVAVARLKEDNEFRKRLGAAVRSIVEREGGTVPHTDLVELIACAIAGPDLNPEMQALIRSLLAFLYQVLPKPWEERAERRLHSIPEANAETPAEQVASEVPEPLPVTLAHALAALDQSAPDRLEETAQDLVEQSAPDVFELTPPPDLAGDPIAQSGPLPLEQLTQPYLAERAEQLERAEWRMQPDLFEQGGPDETAGPVLEAAEPASVAANDDATARGPRGLHLVFSRLPLPGLDFPVETVHDQEEETPLASERDAPVGFASPAPLAAYEALPRAMGIAREPEPAAAVARTAEPMPAMAPEPPPVPKPVPPPTPTHDVTWRVAFRGLQAGVVANWTAYRAWRTRTLRAGRTGIADRLAAFRLPRSREQFVHMAAAFMAEDEPLPAPNDPQGLVEQRTWVAVGLAFAMALVAIALTLASAPQIDGVPAAAATSPHAAPPARVAPTPVAATTSPAPATPLDKPSPYGRQLGPPTHTTGSNYADGEIIAAPHTTNAPGFGPPARPTQPATTAELHEAAHAAPAPALVPAAGSAGSRNPDARMVGDDGTISSARPAGPRISAATMARNVLSAPEPGYPLMARLAHLEGNVVLAAHIDSAGWVADATALSGHHLLRHAAESAVRQWRYRPYVVNGRAIPVSTTIVVKFR